MSLFNSCFSARWDQPWDLLIGRFDSLIVEDTLDHGSFQVLREEKEPMGKGKGKGWRAPRRLRESANAETWAQWLLGWRSLQGGAVWMTFSFRVFEIADVPLDSDGCATWGQAPKWKHYSVTRRALLICSSDPTPGIVPFCCLQSRSNLCTVAITFCGSKSNNIYLYKWIGLIIPIITAVTVHWNLTFETRYWGQFRARELHHQSFQKLLKVQRRSAHLLRRGGLLRARRGET